MNSKVQNLIGQRFVRVGHADGTLFLVMLASVHSFGFVLSPTGIAGTLPSVRNPDLSTHGL
jgi:hypothetical protein